MVCLVEMILGRREREKERERERENGWKGYLVGRGGREENWWDLSVFSLGLPKPNLPKLGRL